MEAMLWPDQSALLVKGANLSYGELERLSNAFAAAVVAEKGEKGERVALLEVWKADEPSPWETSMPAPSHGPAGQPAEIDGAFERLRRESARIHERARLSLRHLSSAVGMLRSPAVPRPGIDGL